MKNLPLLDPKPVPISASEGYRIWSRTYDSDPNPLLALESRTLGRRLSAIAGKFVVDVGCGTGRWVRHAAENGARAAGLDLCMEMLFVAAQKPRLKGRVAQADCHCLPLRTAIADISICSFTIGYLGNPGRAVRELGRITKPGGTIFLTDLHPTTRTRGWRRTFKASGLVYELETQAVDRSQLLDYGRQAGLTLRDVCEPTLGEPESVLMTAAGLGDRFADVSAVPAILCIEWERQ